MLSRLNNAAAIYQRLVNKIFLPQLGRNMGVYVDDILVKSTKTNDHVIDLEGIFEVFRRYKIKFNPTNYAFGVKGGCFLKYMVTKRGIEANPIKIQAILYMKVKSKVNEIQCLTSRIAVLSRFISKSSKKSLPFFNVLKKAKSFKWGSDCQSSFNEFKKYLEGFLYWSSHPWGTLSTFTYP
ncbi:UNVERIFIED_CONTAM: hypothetical protein Sradi_5852900 [Sesamum radiatum]|uniref:Reverse transcriptase domain-containing protein n=1 Tax=Sesamum radiatum TaxID=300843 RepID=A0AAW2KQD0_SESRA